LKASKTFWCFEIVSTCLYPSFSSSTVFLRLSNRAIFLCKIPTTCDCVIRETRSPIKELQREKCRKEYLCYPQLALCELSCQPLRAKQPKEEHALQQDSKDSFQKFLAK
jgi:hypothetical protein